MRSHFDVCINWFIIYKFCRGSEGQTSKGYICRPLSGAYRVCCPISSDSRANELGYFSIFKWMSGEL